MTCRQDRQRRARIHFWNVQNSRRAPRFTKNVEKRRQWIERFLGYVPDWTDPHWAERLLPDRKGGAR